MISSSDAVAMITLAARRRSQQSLGVRVGVKVLVLVRRGRNFLSGKVKNFMRKGCTVRLWSIAMRNLRANSA